MNRRLFSVLLILVLLCGAIPGCGEAAAPIPVHVQGAIFGGRSDDSIPAEISFDPGWLNEDNTVYHRELAAFAALLSADTYFRDKDLSRGTANRVLPDGADDEYDHTCLLRKLGFTETRYVESFKEKAYAQDTNDSVTMILGHLRTEKNDVYVVAFRGCFSAGEWSSVFDVGADSEACGEHPEWIHPDRMKGLDIGAERAKAFISEFMASCDDPQLPDLVMYTGHSRGGCLANLVGADAEKEGTGKTFTYTFNTDSLMTRVDFEAKTVFNLFDQNDLYTDLMPFGGQPLYRYGQDLTLPIAESPEIRRAIAEMKGRDDTVSVTREDIEAYRALFGQRFPDRDSLYDSQEWVRVFDTREEAQESREQCLTLISAEIGLGVEGLCEVSGILQENGQYAYTLTACGAALLHAYSMELGYGAQAYEGLKILFQEDAPGCAIADFLMEHQETLTAGHLLINSYILSQYIP